MLSGFAGKKERTLVGLMSGTSADGVDAALVKIQGQGVDASISLVAFDSLRYSQAVRSAILGCQGPGAGANRHVTLLDAYLGELFAHAALHICKKAQVDPELVDAIGSHGQTLYHHPQQEAMPGFLVRGTRQIGSAAIIAERTGITTVSDFRSRDMAAGGLGAPLVPYLDYVLYHHRSRGRIALNIGGVANVTAIPAGASPDGVIAFDTGPGNCLIDAAAAHFTQGKSAFDSEGSMAMSGRADERLLGRLLEHPYFHQPPPKALDKEVFGRAYFKEFLGANPSISGPDALATLTSLTAKSIAAAILEFLAQKERYEELIVSGGGARNLVLMAQLERLLPDLLVTPADEYGIPAKAKEAVLMAFLAHETLLGRPGNLPSATSARGPAILGAITPGARFFDE
jgi:anhydro-N-acetylmuramic acid kinase